MDFAEAITQLNTLGLKASENGAYIEISHFELSPFFTAASPAAAYEPTELTKCLQENGIILEENGTGRVIYGISSLRKLADNGATYLGTPAYRSDREGLQAMTFEAAVQELNKYSPEYYAGTHLTFSREAAPLLLIDSNTREPSLIRLALMEKDINPEMASKNLKHDPDRAYIANADEMALLAKAGLEIKGFDAVSKLRATEALKDGHSRLS